MPKETCENCKPITAVLETAYATASPELRYQKITEWLQQFKAKINCGALCLPAIEQLSKLNPFQED